MNILAFDTSSGQTHIGLLVGSVMREQSLPGGAHASANLIQTCLDALAAAGLGLRDLDAIAFGAGPGSFTGLRTACAVAQGFGLGADKPLIPVPTLMAVAQDAFVKSGQRKLLAAVDARMGEVYAAQAVVNAQGVAALSSPAEACAPSQLKLGPLEVLACDGLAAYAQQIAQEVLARVQLAQPSGAALVACATHLWALEGGVDAAQAQPLYVRDRVAFTEAERAAQKAAELAA